MLLRNNEIANSFLFCFVFGQRSFKNYHRTACRTEGQIIEVE